MAKGQVSDDDLASGLRNFGGVSSFGAPSGKPHRDNPFRITQAEARGTEGAPKIEPAAVEKQAEKIEPVERRGEASRPVVAAKPREAIVPKAVVRKVETRETTRPSLEAAERSREKKTERYTERVTALLDAELRDGAESLAREISRRRKIKGGERITANTILRVSLRLLLDNFELSPDDAPNDEEEIFTAVQKRIRVK
jgi:hypothetical protein